MSSAIPRPLLEVEYANAAQDYLRSLPPEHFMEARPQAAQREITVESFALLRLHRPDVHYFNELLVQYPRPRSKDIGQVVPDNMVVISAEPIQVEGSFDLPLQPVGPSLVLEYVSKSSKRKDYQDNFRIYERDLKIPYYLLFYPETQDLTLFQRGAKRYVSVKANEAGRVAIPELDLEAAILEGWVRYWYRGHLLQLPADLQASLDALRQELLQAKEETRQAKEETRQAKEETRQADERARQADEKTRQAQEQIKHLLAQLQAQGTDPGS